VTSSVTRDYDPPVGDLLDRVLALRTRVDPTRPVLVGVTGEPGAGKSTLTASLVARLRERGASAVLVPMDGFHLAQAELVRQGTRDRMGAPHTFDVLGYAALLRRLRAADETVYAPAFRREIEEPIAGAIAVPPEVPLVVTEGNYLLLWDEVRAVLDEAWYVEMDEAQRLEWLIARHVEFGKTPEEAKAWVMRSDQRNAEVVASTRGRADLVVRLG